MVYISHLFLGFIIAFIGLLGPGMLNMTAVRTAIDQGTKAGLIFSTGAASMVLIQTSIALIFANFISQNPNVLEHLRIAAVLVFFVLATFFFIQARKTFSVKGKTKHGNLFFMGIFMSALNMLAIPFYFGLSTYFVTNGQLIMQQPYMALYIVGTALGAAVIFFIYVSFAGLITRRAKFIAANINYILSGLFIVLGLIAIFKN